MADKINYGVYPNPLPDAEGKTTYQVRHIPNGTMSEKGFLAHLKYHNTYNTTTMMSSLCVLRDEIIEQLRENKRFRIDGIGTFQMKVGLITKHDEEGNPIKPHFTDPNKITANDVEVQGVSFTPDPSFVKALKAKISTQNKYGRGAAGRNKPYTPQTDAVCAEHYGISCPEMARRTDGGGILKILLQKAGNHLRLLSLRLGIIAVKP